MKHLSSPRNLLTLAIAMAGTWASAGIVYDEAVNSIIVDEYPESFPCSLREIYIADRMNGWGKVEYDKATGAYIINASLVVGQSNETDTHMRIGTAKNPNESLLLKGHLVVHPSQEKRVNRLTIGDERDTGARPVLKLAGKGVFVGSALSSDGKKLRGAGGELRLYNCIVSGAGDTWPEQAAGPCEVSAWKCFFTAVNTDFRNFKGAPTAGIHAYMTCVMEKCVFSDCGAGFPGASRVLKFKGCVFKNFKGPVFASARAELADCAFEGNAMNWDLSRGGYMKCVDCAIGATAKTNLYGTGPNPNTKQDERAFFLDMQHVIVQALDKSGAPVTNAKVAVHAETEESASQDHSITKAGGLTPGKGQDSALLLTKTRTEADGKGGTSSFDYSYSITATHKDKTGTVKGFKPSASWETVAVTLHE